MFNKPREHTHFSHCSKSLKATLFVLHIHCALSVTISPTEGVNVRIEYTPTHLKVNMWPIIHTVNYWIEKPIASAFSNILHSPTVVEWNSA